MERNEFVVIESSRRKSKKGMITAIVMIFLALFLILLLTQFKITSIDMTGNEHYTKEEMETELKKAGYINNSILYMLKCYCGTILNPVYFYLTNLQIFKSVF